MLEKRKTAASLLALAVAVGLGATQARADILGGFFDFGEANNTWDDSNYASGKTADIAEVAGVDVRIFDGDGSRIDVSSSDGIFGDSGLSTTLADSANPGNAAPAENGAFVARPTDIRIRIEVRNNTLQPLELGSLYFDYFIAENASTSGNGGQVDEMQIFYQEGDLDDANGTVLDTVVFPDVPQGFPSGLQDWTDYGISLSGLTDPILGPGERAQFVIQANSGAGPPLFTDNLAITGSLIPTPAALPAGLALLGCFAARRRRRA